LAAGEGTRLRAMIADRHGHALPKQYCSLDGGASLLDLALQRAGQVAPRERVTTIVAARHEPWWKGALGLLPHSNVIVQPDNRGTAVGLLLSVLRVLERDPLARIVVLPSDHFVADEDVLARAMRDALAEVRRRPEAVVLLGIAPEEPDAEFGWIVPERAGGRGARGVRRFVEKPSPAEAGALLREGAVWNSFILAAEGRAILELCERRLRDVVTILLDALAEEARGKRPPGVALGRAYEGLDSADFSRDVLQGCEERLLVLPVPRCGWSDLGTPARVSRCVAQLRPHRPPAAPQGRPSLGAHPH
jgi:mannose-1-phosphate guanylyltransferase